ncbi:hypothetical protein L596_011905 [Steinernema carpocapsae]|uniref:NR LBD domain-containing protein n=1 Tax=Steinernema carpocapsae TaxID=34508 RepID=A0A4U5NVH3_STECR|nr:hypothetical protein L596_011905 [Steinernema carpocapsae]
MRFQENSASPPRTPKSHESVDSSINLPEIIVENHRIVYDVVPLVSYVKEQFNGPRISLKLSTGVRYAPLQRLHLAFHHLYDGERPTTIHEVKLLTFTLVVRGIENIIQRTSRFSMSCTEFAELPNNDKWHLFRKMTAHAMCVVRCLMTVEFFGYDLEDTRIMHTDNVCIDALNFDYDPKQVPADSANTLRSVFRPFCKKIYHTILAPFKQLRITKFETCYILALILWNTEDMEDLSEETHEVADRFLSEAASELHHYYRFEMKVENYAERLTKLVKISSSVEKIGSERKEILALADIFNKFSCDLFTPGYFF